MPTTPIPVNSISRGGIAPQTEAAGDNVNGNTFANNGATWLEVTNGGGSSGTVTVGYPGKVDGQSIPAKSYTLAAAAKRRIGPFPIALFGTAPVVQPSAATITIAAYQLAGS
jgi:hypothetical protein